MKISDRYSRMQIALHWAIAGLIVLNYIARGDMKTAVLTVTEGNAVGIAVS